MAKKQFSKTLSRTLRDQTLEPTWAGFTNVDSFQSSGCAICSIAMYLNTTTKNVAAQGYCNYENPSIITWKSFTKQTSDIYAEVARNILVYGKPVIVHVPSASGHFVLANSFNGLIDCDPDGNPLGTGATARMIGILDPWTGKYSNLADLENARGSADFIRKG